MMLITAVSRVLFYVILAFALLSQARGQIGCTYPDPDTIFNSWPSIAPIEAGVGFTVSLRPNVDPTFGDSTPTVEAAINNWAAHFPLACELIQWSGLTHDLFPYGGYGAVNVFFVQVNNLDDGSVPRGIATLEHSLSDGRVSKASIAINYFMTDPIAIGEVVAHEIGHSFGLGHSFGPWGSSVMVTGATNLNDEIGTLGPTSCDLYEVVAVAFDYACPPPPPEVYECGMTYDQYSEWEYECGMAGGVILGDPYCVCSLASPIIIDTTRRGFHLTSASDGVQFTFGGPNPIQVAWTQAGSGNAFLVLDRNHNGKIENATELFGNFTEQPPSANPNGFAALAVFDQPENGGNADGIIDSRDAIFPSLRLWIDANHNGISEPEELFMLRELGVYSISLDYSAAWRKDQFGNQFRYRARMNGTLGNDSGQWAYDVILATTQVQKNGPVQPCEQRVRSGADRPSVDQ